MKRTILAFTLVAASAAFGAAAYAQNAHDHAAHPSGPAPGHETHCCKPDPSEPRGRYGLPQLGQDQPQTAKKPATKKSDRKPAARVSPNAK